MTIGICEACGTPIFNAAPEDVLCDFCMQLCLLEMQRDEPDLGDDCE